MEVKKALSNNMVLAIDQHGMEVICQGKGIGWKKRQGDKVDCSLIERRFLPENEPESIRFQQLFSEIPDELWSIAEASIEYARSRYAIKVSQKIILTLCDHMAGSIERYQNGIYLENPILWDIKRVYPKEFKTGQYMLDEIERQFGIAMREDEAAFLAYHFINAQLGDSNIVSADTMAKLASDVIDIVQQSFQITLNEDDWNYQRFLTHLKFFVNRVASRQTYEETEDNELFEELQKKYPHVYRCVERVATYILVEMHYEISQEENLYLLIHIERVTRRYRKKR